MSRQPDLHDALPAQVVVAPRRATDCAGSWRHYAAAGLVVTGLTVAALVLAGLAPMPGPTAAPTLVSPAERLGSIDGWL